MNLISHLSLNSNTWKFVALTAFLLELIALYFQYIMGLAPCVMCIYQRTAIWGVFFAGIIGAMGCQFFLIRILAYILWGSSATWGLLTAIDHVDMQSATLSFLYSCEFEPNFPSWAPLHHWLPVLFEATGDCGEINWRFFDFTMPQVMIAVFSCYLVGLAIVILPFFNNSNINSIK